MSNKISPSDRLSEIFEVQTEQDKYWHDQERFDADVTYRNEELREYSINAIDQMMKMLNCFNLKKHILIESENIYNAKEQFIDVFKILLGLGIKIGFTVDEFYNMFHDKTALLYDRWAQERLQLGSEHNVVVFDIDGVIADYDTAFEKFLSSKGFKRKEGQRKQYAFYPLYEGMTRQIEESYHKEFAIDGGYYYLPVFDGMKDLIDYIKLKGVKVILLTSRPTWMYSRLYSDTINWLKRNEIEYDAIYFEADKSVVIVNEIMPANIIAFVEDRDKHAMEVAHTGTKVLLLDKGYNGGEFDESLDIKRVYSVGDIFKAVFPELPELDKRY